MPVPPISPSLQHLATKPFSFYPPILGIEHNEWGFQKATWSEILVTNRKTGQELWISKRYIGEVSRIEEPVVIVGLTKELEYKGGTVWPYQRRVIEMPTAGGRAADPSGHETPPPATAAAGIGRQPQTDTRMVKLIGGVIAIGIAACLLVLSFYRVGDLRARRVTFTTRDQSYLELGTRDDYWAVVHKLGRPSQDRWQNESGTIQFQAMQYPDRGFTVILMGTDRKSAHYIGAMDKNWTPVHSVPLRAGGSTFAMLRGLARF